jgi:hypothetical protein
MNTSLRPSVFFGSPAKAAGVFLLLAATAVGAQTPAPAAKPAAAAAAKPVATATVYKSPTCGCCAKWNEHMRTSGFAVTSNDEPDMAAVKDKHGVPQKLRSCHTALVGGYVIEGHVPADVIRKLLRERPAVVGIAAPGMPNGSPGMEGPTKDTYQILTFDKTGATTVYATR